jgi:hypothetical protein
MKILKMNTLIVRSFALIAILWTSCATDMLTGQTVKENRDVSSFNSLRLSMSADVYVSQGDKQSVVVEADKASMEYIETETNGGTLVIKNREGHWRNLGPIKVYITMKELKEVDLSGSGSMITETPIQAGDIRIELSGSGNVKISDLKATSISSTITGSGDIVLAGSGNKARLDVEITGSGSFRGEDLAVESADVKITGSGSARVNASEDLESDITGSGSVRYKGNPRVNAHSSGSGKTTSL